MTTSPLKRGSARPATKLFSLEQVSECQLVHSQIVYLYPLDACVDMSWGLLTNGNAVQTYTCQDGNTNQLWTSWLNCSRGIPRSVCVESFECPCRNIVGFTQFPSRSLVWHSKSILVLRTQLNEDLVTSLTLKTTKVDIRRGVNQLPLLSHTFESSEWSMRLHIQPPRHTIWGFQRSARSVDNAYFWEIRIVAIHNNNTWFVRYAATSIVTSTLLWRAGGTFYIR